MYGKKEITDWNAVEASSIPEIPLSPIPNVPETNIANDVKSHNIPVKKVSIRATNPCDTGSLVLTVA